MKIINIVVRNKIPLAVNEEDAIVCGNSDYVINFDFDSDWDDYETKTARFIYNGSHTDVVFEGNSVNAPIIYKSNTVSVGVFAGSMRTTTPCIIPCLKSIICEKGPVADPPPDVYAQILEKLDDVKSSQISQEQIKEVVDEELEAAKASGEFDGADGKDGEVGPQGPEGPQGNDGKDGADGVSPIVNFTEVDGGNTMTVTDAEGDKSIRILNGKDGQPGADGEDGKDGISVTHQWDGTTLTITSASGTSSANLKGEDGGEGPQGPEGPQGNDGYTPQKGVDYFTDEDKLEIVNSVLAEFTDVSEVGQ